MYKLNDAKMFADLADGEAIVINTATGIYYAMNPLSSSVFDALRSGASEAAVLEALQNLPGCPDDAARNLTAFLAELLDNEILLKDSEENASVVPVFPPEAALDGWELALEEYDEVQDLIVADPVHDVDDEQGWPVMKQDNANS